MDISDIRFTKSGDVNLAYQTYGSGPDVVVIPPIASNIELSWEEETYRRVREHIGRYIRVLEFDKRGIGSSDRFDRNPTLEERIADIQAVMDAEGVERASLCGLSEGGLMAQLFAAMHPERVDRVVLVNSLCGISGYAQMQHYSDTPVPSPTEAVANVQRVLDTWGRDPSPFVDLFAPSKNNDAAFIRWMARFQRQTATPAEITRQLESILTLDASEHLHEIQAPTLVMHAVGDRVIHAAQGRYLADKIPGARHVDIPGDDHFLWVMDNWRDTMDTWLEFVTGTRPARRTERRFATVLFTDIVGSTARAGEVGDQAWRAKLESHDRIAWKNVDRHAGKLIKNTGDGLLVTFDSPSEAIICASELSRDLATEGLEIRAGLHAGEIEVRDDGDVTGLCVNLAARVQQAARDGSTWVSSTVRDLLMGGNAKFEERGEHELKGIEGRWRLYELSA